MDLNQSIVKTIGIVIQTKIDIADRADIGVHTNEKMIDLSLRSSFVRSQKHHRILSGGSYPIFA